MEKKWFKLLNLLPYIIILFLDFVFWPNFVPLMSGYLGFMLFYMPFIAFITGLVYGIFNGFDFKLPIITIFMLALQIVFGFCDGFPSEWNYIYAVFTFGFFHTIIHTVIVSLGVLIGYVIHMLLKFLGEIFRILFKSLCKHLKK